MNIATWKSIKSPIMQEIRMALKKKPNEGEPTPTRKESNKTWREEILGIFSDDQKKEIKSARQKRSNNKKQRYQSNE